jgi:hypothetical protein
MLLGLLFKKFCTGKLLKDICIYYLPDTITKEHCKKYRGQIPPSKDYSFYVLGAINYLLFGLQKILENI